MRKKQKLEEVEEEARFFAITSAGDVNANLQLYCESRLVQSACFDDASKGYKYWNHGQMVLCKGLNSALFWKYYKHYKDNRSKRKWGTSIKGSSDKRGIRIDKEITTYVANGGIRPQYADPLTTAILNYIESLGHTPQGAQIPVEIPGWGRMTQVDYVSRDAEGNLHVWEVKSGIPVGGFVQQGYFSELRDAENNAIKCTKYHIWQLQLYYESKALELAIGVPIYQSHVIQAYEDRKKGILVKVHDPPEWTMRIPPLVAKNEPKKPPPRTTPIVIDLT